MRSINNINTDPIRFIADTEIPIPVMVCSHERSGTHFLMNSIADNSRYSNDPFLNYDLKPLGSFLNFHDKKDVKTFFERLTERRCASIVKSHFSAAFFLEHDEEFILNDLLKILYIVRNPVEVMLSYHRFIKHFPWHEGPKTQRAITFAGAAPEGQMLRYQSGQADSILERWKLHFLGWLKVAAENKANVRVINYQDLVRDHSIVTGQVLSFLGVDCPDVVIKPDRTTKTVHIPEFRVISFEEREELRKFIVERIGYIEAIESLFPELYKITASD